MSSASSDTPGDSLQIRCPECGQRFTVASELHGRVVECGACEHQFRIDEQSVVNPRKFYPGEKAKATPGQFARTPQAGGTPNLEGVRYAEPPPAHQYEPASPQRLFAGLMAVLIFLIGIWMLMSAGSSTGMLASTPLDRRLLLAGFVAFVGSFLLVYANPRRRTAAVTASMVLTSGLLAAPFFIHGKPMTDQAPAVEPPTSVEIKPAKANGKAILTQLAPLVDARLRRPAGTAPGRVLGIWFDGMEESYKMQVREYIVRMADAELTSHLYPRGDSDYLMVIDGSKVELDQLAKITTRIGDVVQSYPEQGLIRVDVNNLLFKESPQEKLNDPKNPEFYSLNKRELESLDLDRARKAVQRLTAVEPVLMRADILRLLLQLLDQVEPAVKGEICRALMNWSQGEPETVKHVAETLQAMKGELRSIPREMIAFLAAQHEPTSVPVVHQMWMADASVWENLYADYGALAEPQLLAALPNMPDIMQRHSAVRILHRVGTPASLPVLEAAKTSGNAEFRALVERAQTAIRERAKK